ncbi:ABC transporter ATP-binding protein [Roseococcus sp. YIM B11640]|uniref:ABC transporter ATP-binding protein n=1 Tax=Roseococcus sp. YIM B11640 TaxID=3133973 RepID=UPI003C7B8C0C
MLELSGVCKSFVKGGIRRDVLKGVDATFWPGDAVGILGRNGAGKSTLMRIMSGVEQPTAGRVRRNMSISWPIGFSGAVHDALTGADNARFIARLYDRKLDWVESFVKDFSELGDQFRAPVKTYSSGMRARLIFALSLAIDFDCYLVDEVIAVGDARFNEKCRQSLLSRRGRSALILVSHQVETVRSLCSHAAILNEGRLTFHEDLDQAFAEYQHL